MERSLPSSAAFKSGNCPESVLGVRTEEGPCSGRAWLLAGRFASVMSSGTLPLQLMRAAMKCSYIDVQLKLPYGCTRDYAISGWTPIRISARPGCEIGKMYQLATPTATSVPFLSVSIQDDEEVIMLSYSHGELSFDK